MTELELKLNEYYEKFSERYPLFITQIISDEELLIEINDCIKLNKKAVQFEIEEGMVY